MTQKPTLSLLANPSWRGIEFLYTETRDFGFSHESQEHRYIFRDQQLIESLGRKNPSFRYHIPFYDSLKWPEPLFRVVYPKFLAACLNRSRGELVDPIHGRVKAKCASLQESADVSKLDGVSVVAEFIFAPEDDTDQASNLADIASSLPQLERQAIRYSDAVRRLSETQKAKLSAPDPNILQSLRAAAGSVVQARNKAIATASAAITQLENTRADIEDAADPQLESVRREAGRLVLSLKKAVEAPPGSKVVASVKTMSRVAFAIENGVTLQRLLELNPELVNMLFIPAGSKVRLPVGR